MSAMDAHVTIEILGERRVLNGRDAAVISEMLRAIEDGDPRVLGLLAGILNHAARIRTIPFDHAFYTRTHVDGRRVHMTELWERAHAGMATSATG